LIAVKETRKNQSVKLSDFLRLFVGAAVAATMHQLASDDALFRPGENIARGKACSLSPNPDYRLCTDPGDPVQLTDGVYTTGYFWTQASTVG